MDDLIRFARTDLPRLCPECIKGRALVEDRLPLTEAEEYKRHARECLDCATEIGFLRELRGEAADLVEAGSGSLLAAGSTLRAIQAAPAIARIAAVVALASVFGWLGGRTSSLKFPESPKPPTREGSRQATTPKSGASSNAVRALEATDKWAVIIGVGEDQTTGRLGPPTFSDADAKDLFYLLTGQLGYSPTQIALLTGKDATASNIRYALGGFLSQAGPTSSILIYFSGHGFRDERHPDHMYLLTADVEPDLHRLAANALPLSELQALVSDLRSKQVVLLLDACYSGPDGQVAAVSLPAGALGSGRLLVTSSSGSEMALALPRQRGSIFAINLIAGIVDGTADASRDGVITLREIFDYVAQRVRDQTSGQQNPRLTGDERVASEPFAVPGVRLRPSQPPTTLGSLRVLGYVPKAGVRLDGQLLGGLPSLEGSLLVTNLRPGSHVLEVSSPTGSWKSSIVVEPGSSKTVFVAPDNFMARPQPASVSGRAAPSRFCVDEGPWVPIGYMPDGNGIAVKPDFRSRQASRTTALEVAFAGDRPWAGLYWLPNGNWGDQPGVNIARVLGLREREQAQLSFWARGQRGREVVEFRIGGINRGKYPDSVAFPISSGHVRLTQDWKQYSIEIPAGTDLSNLVGGFGVIFERRRNDSANVQLYVDAVCYTRKQ